MAYDPPWPGSGELPVSLRGMSAIFPLIAVAPAAPSGGRERITLVNLAERFRLAVTPSTDPALIWVWARNAEDARSAASVMAARYGTVLEFTPSAQAAGSAAEGGS